MYDAFHPEPSKKRLSGTKDNYYTFMSQGKAGFGRVTRCSEHSSNKPKCDDFSLSE